MKRILILLLIVCLPIVYAENETTDVEIEVFGEQWGATVRLLQLERAVMKNLLIGETVFNVITNNHPEFNTTEMNSLIVDLEVLLDEIRAYEILEEPKESASEYLSFKERSIEASRDFKQLASKILTNEDKEEIKDNISIDLSEINNEIKESLRALHAERAKKMFKNFGTEKPNIVARIRNGSLTKAQINNEIKNRFKELSVDNKIRVVKKVLNETKGQKEELEQLKAKAKKTMEEIHKIRLQNAIKVRVSKLQNRTSNMMELRNRVITRLNQTRMQQTGNRIQNISTTDRGNRK